MWPAQPTFIGRGLPTWFERWGPKNLITNYLSLFKMILLLGHFCYFIISLFFLTFLCISAGGG